MAQYVPEGYALSWQDDFQSFKSENWSRGLESDTTNHALIWNPNNGGPGLLNDSYAGYITDEDAYVKDGVLYLANQKRPYTGTDPVGDFEYTSGWVNTLGKRTIKGTENGVYIEIKAQFPSGYKVWPAIWLVTDFPRWPPEIDIWEYFGHYWNADDVMYMRYIYPLTEEQAWLKENHSDESVPIKHFDRDYDCEAWHVYGYQWTDASMIWTIDGEVVHTLNRDRIPNYWPDEDFSLVMNNGVQTNATDTDTDWPNYLVIDYVAVYEVVTD